MNEEWSPPVGIACLLLLAGGLVGQDPFLRPLELPFPEDILATVDIDGDGDIDVLGRGRAYLNDGGGIFLPGPAVPVSPGRFGAGDLDGDGDVDMVTSDGKVYLAGPAGYAQVASIGSAGATYLADVDVDGDLDVVTCPHQSAGEYALWLNDGAGNFSRGPLRVPTVGWGDIPSTPLVDLDLDGDPDLVDRHSGAYLNDGYGGFTPFPLPGFVGGLLVADFNGDSLPDYRYSATGREIVATGVPGGFGALAVSTTYSGVHPVAALDVDGDGDELIGADSSTLGAVVHDVSLTTGVDPLPMQEISPWNRVEAIFDVDGDGDRDLILGHRLYLANGSGRLAEQFADYPSFCHVDDAGDLDGDGAVDMVGFRRSATAGEMLVHVVRNDGRGRFERLPSTVSMPIDDFGALVPLDVDGDGDQDLIGFPTQQRPRDPVCYVSTPGGLSARPFAGNPLLLLIDAGAMASGDVTGDGATDVLIASDGTGWWPSGVVIWGGDGAGDFLFRGSLPTSPDVSELLIDDVDGDGDLDVVQLHVSANGLLRLNAGQGNLTTTSAVFSPARSGVLLDVEPDGDRDVVINDGAGIQVFANDGLGNFSSLPHMTVSAPAAPGLGPMVAGDVNLDGIGDIWATGGVWLRGDGGGAFTAIPTRVSFHSHWNPSIYDARPRLEDMDRDGDPDLVVWGQIWWNRTRHTALVTPARWGSTAVLSVSGPPGQPYVLGISMDLGSNVTSPYGNVFLDPGATAVLAVGSLDAIGEASVGVAVAPFTPLFTLHAQSAVGSYPRLTNVATISLTN